MGYPFGATCLRMVACSILPAYPNDIATTQRNTPMSTSQSPSTAKARITENVVGNVLANAIWLGLLALLGNLSIVLSLLVTGLVNLGVGPFLMLLGWSLLVAVVTFVIATRRMLSAALSVGVGQWELINVLTAKVYGGKVRFTGIDVGTVAMTVYKLGTYPPPNDKLRARLRHAGAKFLLWLLVPKQYLEYFRDQRQRPWTEPLP